MEIQVTTDDHVHGSEALILQVETEVDAALSRFADHLTRVEVHLGDENGDRDGDADKRCMVEARPAGQQPVAVTYHATTLDEARRGALQKVQSLLEHKFGRQNDRGARDTIRRAPEQ